MWSTTSSSKLRSWWSRLQWRDNLIFRLGIKNWSKLFQTWHMIPIVHKEVVNSICKAESTQEKAPPTLQRLTPRSWSRDGTRPTLNRSPWSTSRTASNAIRSSWPQSIKCSSITLSSLSHHTTVSNLWRMRTGLITTCKLCPSSRPVESSSRKRSSEEGLWDRHPRNRISVFRFPPLTETMLSKRSSTSTKKKSTSQRVCSLLQASWTDMLKWLGHRIFWIPKSCPSQLSAFWWLQNWSSQFLQVSQEWSAS